MNADPISSKLGPTKLKTDGDQGGSGRIDVQDQEQPGGIKLGTVRTKAIVQTSS